MTPVDRKGRLLLAMITAIFGILIIYLSSGKVNIPDRSKLQSTSGKVSSLESGRNSVRFTFVDDERLFNYSSIGREFSLVKNNLKRDGIYVTILFDMDKPVSSALSKGPLYQVYEISISGSSLRSYDEIKAAWEMNNYIGIGLGIFFLFGSGLLFFTRIS